MDKTPMTAAERQRKYRERLKKLNEPKLEEIRMKNLNRINNKYKKIGELSEQDREARRKLWRHRKTPKNHKEITENKIRQVSDSKKYKKKYNRQYYQNKKLKEKLFAIAQENEALRKRIYRYKIVLTCTRNNDNLDPKTEPSTPESKTNAIIDTLNVPMAEKAKVRQILFEKNVLEASLKRTYEKANDTKKRLLKGIVQNEMVRNHKLTTKFRRVLGLKEQVRVKIMTRKEPSPMKKRIQEFYLQDDVSVATAGKKETKTYKKVKMQKRLLLDTMRKLYEKFKNETGFTSVSYSSFMRYRPFYVLKPNLSDRDTCACKKHSNIEFKFNALKRLMIFATESTLDDVVRSTVGDKKNQKCMYAKCQECLNKTVYYDVSKTKLSDKVTWIEWSLKTFEYLNKVGQKKIAKKTVKVIKSGTLRLLITEFEKELTEFKVHIFNIIHQYNAYKDLKENMTEEELMIHCDFTENYSCKFHQEIQAVHFGASHNQITLHTSVIYVKNHRPYCFATLLDSNNHGPEAIWTHLRPILKDMKKQFPSLSTVHFFSDGPSIKYRQKKKFYLLSSEIPKLGYKNATWNFSEASHGKGAADGVGGAVKRMLDAKVTHGFDITNANTAFELLKLDTSINLFVINEDCINKIEKSLQECFLVAVPNTMKVHQVCNLNQLGKISYRILSCFCNESDKRGYCSCFLSNIHLLKMYTNDSGVEDAKNDKSKLVRRRIVYSSSDSESDDNSKVTIKKVTILSDIKVNYKLEELKKLVKASKSYNVSSIDIKSDFKEFAALPNSSTDTKINE